MQEGSALREFYEEAYSHRPAASARYGEWRALGARGKADHVVSLCARAGVVPARTLEVGCGDGALLSELGRRGFGGDLDGIEIARAAVEIASTREEISSVTQYDGDHVPAPSGAYDLGILSHVLEHVDDPAALLREVARACAIVIVEVPLEQNVSARRPGKRDTATEVGHIQRFDRGELLEVIDSAGLRVAAALQDALPRAVHVFGAASRVQRARAVAKWGLRASIDRVAPRLARRLFTVHYAAICMPRQ